MRTRFRTGRRRRRLSWKRKARPSVSDGRRKTAPFIALAIAVVCAALFVLLAGATNDDSETARTPLMGRPAPDAIGELADETTFDLARRKGSWVVLNFFDPTCIPCVN